METLAIILISIIGLAAALPEMDCPRPEWKKRRANNHCYWFELDLLPQYKADERCRRYDGKLVKIDDASENDWLLKNVLEPTPTAAEGFLGGGSDQYFYMGLKNVDDVDGDGIEDFRWEVDGTLLDWAGMWDTANGQPDNYRNKENCVVLFKETGEWSDVMCGDNYNFVCEYVIPPPPPTTAAP